MATRYAIYFVPAASSMLWRFGCQILGQDAYSGVEVPQWLPDGPTPGQWQAMTADPRLYGFHATLKAPFRLAEGREETDIAALLAAFAREHSPVDLGPWGIQPIGSSHADRAFLAVTPLYPPAALSRLESAIVRGFDTLRAPLTPAEIARRTPERLTERQRFYLEAHGYPYVLDEFRFHMTLTGAIEGAAAMAEKLSALAQMVGVEPSLHLDRLGLFRQDDGGRFQIVTVAALG